MSTATTQTVLVTGASSGIGRATALCFAAEGARLVLTARGDERLQQVAGECRARGAAAVLTVTADIGEQADVQRMFDAAVAREGRVDVVVQNASVAAIGEMATVPADVSAAVLRTNVLGPVHVSQAALRHFRDWGGGCLVVVGSLFGHTAVPLLGPYVMSKFAVTALVRVLRQETRGDSGIVIRAVYPGAVNTPIYGHAANYLGRLPRVPPLRDSPEKVARRIVAASHARRSGERQVGLMNLPILLCDRVFPRIFDRIAAPVMKVVGFTAEPIEPTSGNVFDPG